MTNVSATPRKVATRRGLFALAEDALRKEGWSVVRVPRGGKSSLRMIVRGDECYKVSIRTSQDAWIAFPRRTAGEGWITLDEVDFVVAASVNDKHTPTEARVHMIPGNEARDRFNRAYAARKAAGHTLPVGRGIWLSLYDEDSAEPVTHVGAGMGLAHRPIAVVDLTKAGLPSGEAFVNDEVARRPLATDRSVEPPLTISDAKRRLADSLGVPESAIRITIEH
jgi:hypothetical protein